jgi:hypothetical protein
MPASSSDARNQYNNKHSLLVNVDVSAVMDFLRVLRFCAATVHVMQHGTNDFLRSAFLRSHRTRDAAPHFLRFCQCA